jgi:hypothetical protein
MPYTNLADVIVPEVMAKMAAAQIPTASKIVRSGIVSLDYNNVDIGEGGNFFNVPFYDELTGASEVIDGVNQIAVNAISTGKDIGVVLHRGKAWGVTDLARFAGMEDPSREIGRQVGNYWSKEFDRLYVAILNAHIAASGPLNSSHLYDVSVTTGTKVLFDTGVAIDASLKLGDNMDDLTGMIIHSKVYGDLVKNKLVEFVDLPSTDNTYRTAKIPTFLGKELVVSDQCPIDTSTPGYEIYTSYLFGPGAGYLGYQRQLMTEKDRDILAFRNVLSTSVHFGLHLKLVKWNVSTVNPDDSTLGTATNWAKVASDDKLIKFVAVKSN